MSEEKKQTPAPSVLEAKASADLQKSVEADLAKEDPEQKEKTFAKLIETPPE